PSLGMKLLAQLRDRTHLAVGTARLETVLLGELAHVCGRDRVEILGDRATLGRGLGARQRLLGDARSGSLGCLLDGRRPLYMLDECLVWRDAMDVLANIGASYLDLFAIRPRTTNHATAIANGLDAVNREDGGAALLGGGTP